MNASTAATTQIKVSRKFWCQEKKDAEKALKDVRALLRNLKLRRERQWDMLEAYWRGEDVGVSDSAIKEGIRYLDRQIWLAEQDLERAKKTWAIWK